LNLAYLDKSQNVFFNDCLQLITNDKFVSVEHRVLANRGEEPRISSASFFMHTIPNEQVYGPMKELLSKQNPPKYRNTTTTEMARHYLARGLDGTSPLLHFRISVDTTRLSKGND
jgi:isopenicillin N synthase-like dioxygenase